MLITLVYLVPEYGQYSPALYVNCSPASSFACGQIPPLELNPKKPQTFCVSGSVEQHCKLTSPSYFPIQSRRVRHLPVSIPKGGNGDPSGPRF